MTPQQSPNPQFSAQTTPQYQNMQSPATPQPQQQGGMQNMYAMSGMQQGMPNQNIMQVNVELLRLVQSIASLRFLLFYTDVGEGTGQDMLYMKEIPGTWRAS